MFVSPAQHVSLCLWHPLNSLAGTALARISWLETLSCLWTGYFGVFLFWAVPLTSYRQWWVLILCGVPPGFGIAVFQKIVWKCWSLWADPWFWRDYIVRLGILDILVHFGFLSIYRSFEHVLGTSCQQPCWDCSGGCWYPLPLAVEAGSSLACVASASPCRPIMWSRQSQ